MSLLHNNDVYYYKSSYMFHSEVDNVRAFVMKNYEIGMHMQEFFEINIITRGMGKHYISNNCIDAKMGDVFIIPPNASHGYTGGEGFDVLHVLVSNKFIEKNMSDFQMLPSFSALFSAEPLLRAKSDKALHLKLTERQFGDIKPILTQALKYDKSRTVFHSLILNGSALAIISLLCRAYTENSENYSASGGDKSFINAISYIHEHYHEKITIDELARIACLSRSSFVRKFKKICGMTPLDYITKRRIEVAEYMLLNTNFPLLDIAYKSGFYDAAHFSRAFIRYKGVSPYVYKKKALASGIPK